MSGNWIETKLEDICEITMGQSPKSEFYNTEGEGIPFLQGNRTFGDKYPTFDTYTTKITKVAEINDVIMSVRAPVGDVNITQAKICIGRGVCGLRHRENAQDFLYYLMCYYKQTLINQENGTVFGSVNKTDISNLSVLVPSLTEQVEIAEKLKAIDDKIEINRKINHHLEQIAQAIFINITKNDANWKTGTLAMLIDFKNGKSRPNTPGKIPIYGGNGVLSFTNINNASNTVIIGRVGAYCGSLYLETGTCWVSDNAIFTKSKLCEKEYYNYFLLRSLGLSNRHVGTSQPLLTQGILNAIEIKIPTIEIMQEYNNTVSPIFDKIHLNTNESTYLASLRDKLLVRLLSGELSVAKLHEAK